MIERSALLLATAVLALIRGGSSLGDSSSVGIAAGGLHTCAVVAGAAKCWGDDAFGELGDGGENIQFVPTVVSGLGSGVTAVAAGLHHTCAVLSSGGVKCWGWNVNGQLGDGTYDDHARPVSVKSLTRVRAVAAAGGHTCAPLDGGGVECWGWNEDGELGDGTRDTRRTPVAVSGLSGARQVVAAGDVGEHTCALLATGAVECWGSNEFGQLGVGTELDFRTTPVPVSGLESGVRAIAAGGALHHAHTCALLDRGGVKCWGDNLFGQLGDGTHVERTRPVAVSGLSNEVTAIAAGDGHTCALLSGGTVKCWGWNDEGQLGDGTAIDRSRPVTVRGLSGVTAVAAGGGHTCALLSSGAIKCWGLNGYGQLGDGTRFSRRAPVKVLGLASGVSVLLVRVKGRGTVGGVGIRCPIACGYERPRGAKVALRARAVKDWAFKSWFGACKGHRPRCRLALRANSTVVAVFVKRSSHGL